MKTLIALMIAFFGVTAQADEFHFRPHFMMGAGLDATKKHPLYLTQKVSFMDVSEDNQGVQFLGLGTVVEQDQTYFSVSPIMLYSGNFAMAVDWGQNATGGVSFGFTFHF